MPTTPEYEKLRKQVEDARKAYYVHSASTITDFEYDALARRLAAMEAELGIDDPTSPTRDVGSDLAPGFQKVRHATPMLSLDNIFTEAEILQFFKDPDLLVIEEPKIDGLSLDLSYVNGQFAQAVTRGNGREGDDVTEQARTIESIPQTLTLPLTFHVRGECYMRRSVFARLNEERAAAGDDLLKTARNAASGSLKQKDPAETAKRRLDFLAYWASSTNGLTSDSGAVARLQALGFDVPSWITVPAAKAFQHIQTFDKARDRLDYDTDGVVLKVDDLKLRGELGEGTHAPKWAVAFKFPPERKATLLRGIVATVGKTGQVCPNAVLAPVVLGGATVTAASLMNQDEMERIGSPAVGDDVWVERSGEVIPRVVGIAKKAMPDRLPWTFPADCPSCGAPLQRNGVHWFCINREHCPAQIEGNLIHATGKTCLDWDGCGEATIRALFEGAGVARLVDLFRLPNAAVLSCLKGAAAAKFLAERERVKKAPLWRKLHACGFDGVGSTISKELAQRYGSMRNIASHFKEITFLYGPVRTRGLMVGMADMADDLTELETLGFTLEDEAGTDKTLAGLSFVITGTLVSGGRDQVAAKIEAKGGLVKNSVTKTTSYLVVGEAPGQNKKLAAEKHGVKIIDETELYRLMGETLTPAAIDTEEKEY
jgi:DNA ligase (NAD+)